MMGRDIGNGNWSQTSILSMSNPLARTAPFQSLTLMSMLLFVTNVRSSSLLPCGREGGHRRPSAAVLK
jgi:hypothetical protein